MTSVLFTASLLSLLTVLVMTWRTARKLSARRMTYRTAHLWGVGAGVCLVFWLRIGLQLTPLPGPWPERLVGFDLATVPLALLLTWILATRKPPPITTAIQAGGAGDWQAQAEAYRMAMDAMSEGISIVDGNLRTVLMNRTAREILDFPEDRFPAGLPYDAFIRANAERGEYGPGDVETLVAERVALARRFEPHLFERTRPNGSVIQVQGTPIPGGGFVTLYRDVTRERRAEEELRRERQLLQTVFDHAPVGIAVKDQHARYRMINPTFSRLFDLKPEEVIGKTFAETGRGAEQQRARVAKEDGEILEYGSSVSIAAAAIVTPQGEPGWYRVVKAPLLDDHDHIEGLVTVTLDVTQQRQAEEDLRQQQQLLQRVFDTIPHRMFIKDRDNRFVMINERLVEDTGISAEAFMGRTLTDMAIFPPEVTRDFTEKDLHVLRTGESLLDDTTVFQDETGRERFYNIIRVPWYDGEGEVAGLVGMREDITERVVAERAGRESRRFLEAVIDAIPHPLSVKDRDGAYLVVNRALREFRLLDDEALRDPAEKVNLGLERQGYGFVLEMDREVLATGAMVERTDVPVVLPRGGNARLHFIKVPILDDRGEIQAIAGLSIDITDRVLAEQEVRESRRFLEAVINAVPHALWVKDLEGRYLVANQALAGLRGSTPEQMLGKRSDQVKGMLERDINVFLQMDREVMETLEPSERDDLMITRFNGESSWRHIVKAPILDESGQLRAVVGISSDVTRRVAAEREIRESRRFLEAVVNAIPHALWVKDLDGRYLLVNQALAEFRGTTTDALIGKGAFDLPNVVQQDAEIFQELDRAVLETGRPVARPNLRVTRPDGSKVWRDMVKAPIFDEHGAITAVVGISSDAELRKSAEERARGQQQLLEAIINALPHIIYAKDLEGRYLLVNQGMADFRATTRDALLGTTVTELPDIAPDEAAALADMDRQVLEQNRLVEIPELFIHRAGGRPSWRRMMKLPLHDEDGNISAIVGVGEDITGRYEAEQALREHRQLLKTVFDALPVAIFLKDRDLRYRMVNRAAAEFYGMSEETILGSTVQELPGLTESSRLLVDSTDREVLDTGKQLYMTDVRMNAADGKPSVRDLTKLPLRDDNGEITGVLVLSLDITEKVALEEQLRHSQKMEAIGQLSGGVAHDFNNLLTVVLGNLELLRHNLGPEHRLNRYVVRSTEAAERGAMLTQRMLAFSRKQALNPERTHLNELLTTLLDLIRSSLGETIEVQMELQDNLWPVSVDRHQLENAVINLAVNARDAMPRGGRLTLTTYNAPVDAALAEAHAAAVGEYVALEVSDTGTGMDEEVLKRAMDPFFSTKEVGKGSGLGLSMVYGFLKQSGGIFQIRSEPGRGTTACLYLPRDQGREQHHPHRVKPAVMRFEGNSERILVVEDDPEVRVMAMELLRDLGYEPIAAENAEHALNLLENGERLDLLFSDLVLPGELDGRALADHIRKRFPDLPVVLTSGYAEKVLAHSGPLERGMTLLTKPYHPSELAEAIRKGLRRPDAASSA